ncbi:uncharacterized protein LOC124290155 [Haliotis rubra]|uniref:uncharacterized protein LOC124290155 n=1 Tax=Haliotis rubra TaxID=36100 RepID=UPI001EE4F95C|nr:uncharacterized protein LOC124290155 [Haliotis rubra]
MIISVRTLKRVLSKCKLHRRKGHSDMEVALFILQQCDTSGNCNGYRWMHRKCQESGLIVSKETILILMNLIDPEGVRNRKKCRLACRSYISTGPNALWHMDGYDKLKPYGICIHGCVDGFSRCVLWMDAWTTNNDPKVVAGYYLDTVERLHGCPERIRSDAGGENRHVEQMQLLLRHDHNDRFAGSESFLYGSSVHNQRIEFWWGILRKQCVQYWMDMFKHLKNEDLFCGDYLDKSLVQFCFLDVIQKEIKDVAQTWNFHQIRANKNSDNPSGKPSVLFSLPQLYGAEDHLKPVCPASLELCRQESTPRGEVNCDPTVHELCTLIMEDMQWQFPDDKKNLTFAFKK